MVERSVHIGKVRGPIPLATTMKKLALLSCLSFVLTITIASQGSWPGLISRQTPIDPYNLHEEIDTNPSIAYFDNQIVKVPQLNFQNVLGQDSSAITDKRIEVDLSTQQTYAYEGNQLIHQFTISSGKWGRTHPGDYLIWAKIRSQKMSGGSKDLGTYYYLPNVPYILFFYNKDHPKAMGYSFHGTYWHNNFGTPMSHGCVNMKSDEARLLYEWADIGTPIHIYGQYQYPQISR